MNTKIYIIRHGESDFNANYMHLVGGRSSHSPLTIKGENQAKLLGEYLLNQNITFDKVFSSTAVRAIDTAKISLFISGYPLEEIVLSDKLLELDQGDWVGKPRIEAYSSENIKLMNSDPWNFAAPNGESQRQVEDRMLNFLYNNVLNRNYSSVAIYGHGMAFKCLTRGIMNLNPELTYKMVLDNTSITEFNYDNNKLNLIKWNDTTHLK